MTARSPTTKPPSEEKVLLERPHGHVHFFVEAEVARRSAPALADDAGGVRIVDEDPRVVPVRRRHQVGEVHDRPGGAEDAVGDDELRRVDCGSFVSTRSRSAISLCLYRTKSANAPLAIRFPATMHAWLSLSDTTYSPFCTSVGMIPCAGLVSGAEEEAGFRPKNFARRSSSSTCRSSVPVR